MIETLLLMFFTVTVIVGAFFALKSDQVLGFFGDLIRSGPEWFSKPTVMCPVCMASVWGTVIFWLFHSGSLIAKLLLWPFFILGTAGLARLINLALQAIRKEAEEAGEDD